MGRRSSRAAPVLHDEDDILRTYKLSSLSPERWEVTDDSDNGPAAGPSGSKSDEPDALGLRRGGTLAFALSLLLSALADQLRVPHSMLPDLPQDLRSAIMLHSKSFDPKNYLATVHPSATFKDLSYGREHLKEVLEQRSEALKVLVEAEFDRFVGVKAATEDVYQEMKQGPLQNGSDFGVKDLKQTLKEASTKADSVYTPILDAAMKATRLRSTLTVFERNKFFFNLPGQLLDAIEHGRYDTAMLAYKKGKYMVEGGRPQTLLGLPPTAQTTPLQEEQAKRIYNKVWSQVQKIMNDLKLQLSQKLGDPKLSPEEVDKTIEFLLELDPDSDPAWIYLESQHKQMKIRITRAFESSHHRYETQSEQSRHKHVHQDELGIAMDIRTGVLALDSQHTDQVISDGSGALAWKAMQDLIKEVSEAILTSLPSFWKVAKSYMEGRYHKRNIPNSSRRNFTYCNDMTNEIVMHFITTLSQFFNLSHEHIQPPPANSDQPLPPLPVFVPEGTVALTAAHYLIKLLTDLGESVTELVSLNLPKQSSEDLNELMINVRWRFADTLCLLWVRDSKILYRLETWAPDPDVPSTTLYLRQADAFQRGVARRIYRVAGGSEDRAGKIFLSPLSMPPGYQAPKKENLASDSVQRIQTAYLDALYAFLDGLVHVAFSEASDEICTTSELSRPGRSIDVSNVDTRIMLTVSNLEYVQNNSIKKALGQLSDAFGVDISEDLSTIRNVIRQIDHILFDNYVQRKAGAVAEILQKGILQPETDWYSAPKPTAVHSYIYEALLQLVLIHSQVTSVAKSLVNRVLATIVNEMATESLRCFEQVERFGLGGMLQATLEIEFMHQTINQYVSPEADTKLQDIYKTISQSYYRQPNKDPEELPRELEQLKKTLTACRRATALQFLCFRRASSKKQASSKT